MSELEKDDYTCTCDRKNEKKHLSGIVCNVTNCVHHDCETHCTANEIAVGPSSAQSAGETRCATFREKKEF